MRASAAAVGTTVEISDIFFNTPARRKFLKSPATELSQICDVINRTALAYPAVHFRLQHDGRNVADYVAVRHARDRLRQILGSDVAEEPCALFSAHGRSGNQRVLQRGTGFLS